MTFPGCASSTFTSGVSTCGETLTRATLGCGEPGSQFDDDCCYRTPCTSDDDCGEGGRCLLRVTEAPGSTARGAAVEECRLECGDCRCTTTKEEGLSRYCVNGAEDVTSFDCNVADKDCDELQQWHQQLVSARWDLERGLQVPAEVEGALNRCYTRVTEEQLVRCKTPLGCACTEGPEPHCVKPLPQHCVFGASCAPNLARMHSFEFCDRGFYAECDDGTIRLLWEENEEQTLEMEFDAGRALIHSAESGFVVRECLDDWELGSIEAGVPPASANCRKCQFCDANGENPLEAEACQFDSMGNVSIP